MTADEQHRADWQDPFVVVGTCLCLAQLLQLYRFQAQVCGDREDDFKGIRTLIGSVDVVGGKQFIDLFSQFA